MVYLFHGFWSRKLVADHQDCVFLFGDNCADASSGYVPSSTQAVIRGLPNAIGIPTKRNRFTSHDSYFTDADFEYFCKRVDFAIDCAIRSGKHIVIPADGIGTGKAQLRERAPKCYAYLVGSLNLLVKHINKPES